MNKRVLQWLIALAVILPCLLISASAASGSVVASGDCGVDGSNVTYKLWSDGELVISGSGAMNGYTYSSRPWYSYMSKITKATIKSGVTTIGNSAFYNCDGLTSVTIPNSVTSIGWGAFDGCTGLTSVTIGNSVTEIGSYAFGSCTSLSSVTIPDSVTSIGNGAFDSCTSLTSVTIPDSVTSIGSYAFYSCDNLSAVTIGNSVTSIGDNAFCDCDSLTAVTIDNSPTNIGADAFYSCDSLSTVTIPSSVASIGDSAFGDCKSLTVVTIENGPTVIGPWAFTSCDNLTTVTIGNGVTNIGDYAFTFCKSLTRVEFLGNAPTDIGSCVFDNSNALTVYYHENTIGWPSANTWNKRPLVKLPALRYSIFVVTVFNGTVTTNRSSGKAGETVTVTAAPAEGYRLTTIKVDGVAIEGNTFTVTGNHTVTAEFTALLTFMGSTVEMGNALNMQFAVSTTIVANNPGCYVKMNGPSGEQIAYQDQWNNPGGYYLVPYFGIAAKNMCDDITAVICAADGTEISVVRTDSIRGYVMRMVDKQNDLLKTLMVDMLNYGAEAQKYFAKQGNYTVADEDLANAQLTAAQLAYGTQTNPELTSEQVKGANYVGSTLDLSSQLMLRIVFKNITRDMHAVATFTNSKGVVQTQEIDGSEFSTVGSYLVADITKAVVADCRCLVNVEVFDAEGNVVASASDSMASYAARQSSGDLYDICMSIMKFADSARAYVNR